MYINVCGHTFFLMCSLSSWCMRELSARPRMTLCELDQRDIDVKLVFD